jgi:hypothetical protein
MLLLWGLPAEVEARFAFTTNDGIITITRYTGSRGAVVTPNFTNNYLVASIGDQAFYFCTGLSSVTLGNNTLSSSHFRIGPTTTQAINETENFQH